MKARARAGEVWRHKETGELTTIDHESRGTVRHIHDSRNDHWLLASSLFHQWYEKVRDCPSMAKPEPRTYPETPYCPAD